MVTEGLLPSRWRNSAVNWKAAFPGASKSIQIATTNLQIVNFKWTSSSSPLLSSVTQSCPTLWDPMDCSTPGLPVHHQLREFTQTHVHWVGDAVQPSHPLLLPLSIFSSIRVFSNESVLHIRWPRYGSFCLSISPSNEYSDSFPLEWTSWISLQSKGLSRVFSNTTVQKHQFFSTQLSL